MKYSENATIINEYRNAFRKYANNGIINMDACLKHTFSFQIHRLEDVISAWEGIVPAYRQSQFFITLAKTGAGEKTIGHFSFPIQKNTLFVVPRGVPHSSKYWSLECSGFMLSFDIGLFFKHLLPQNFIVNKRIFNKCTPPFINLTNEQTENLSVIFEDLLEEYNEERVNKDEMIVIKVLELLIQCDRYFANADPLQYTDSYSTVIESFNELIQHHFSIERSVQFYANALHIHPNYLNFLMKKYTGMTAKQAIAGHIFLEAKGLLRSSSLTLKEISFKLGFTSPGCFSSFFKKMSNLPPSRYRRDIG